MKPICALCGHLKVDHRHTVLPWWSEARAFHECKVFNCPCERYVEDCTPEEAERGGKAA